MGCTSSKTRVVVTNITTTEGKPSTLDGNRKDVNNNDASASLAERTGDENRASTATEKHIETNVHVIEQSQKQEVHYHRKNRVNESNDKVSIPGSERGNEEKSNNTDLAQGPNDIEPELEAEQFGRKPVNGHKVPTIVAENEEEVGLRLSSRRSLHSDSIEDSKIVQTVEASVSKKGKYQLFSSVDDFKDVDFHALHVCFLLHLESTLKLTLPPYDLTGCHYQMFNKLNCDFDFIPI